MLFSKSLAEITFSDFEEFCSTWPEGVRVEYKRLLVANHIPKVVSSFANTVGGVWIIGVETDANNRPVLPIRGFPREPGIDERITQACYQNLYPPLLPEVRIIDVPGVAGNVVVVVQVAESHEAPYAIENSTKIHVRTNSTTEVIQLAEIDRIEYLLKRRQQPEQKREEMIDSMANRSRVSAPCVRVVVGPRYPWRPVLSGDVLAARLQALSQDGNYNQIGVYARLIRQGFISMPPLTSSSPRPDHHFEINLYGLSSYYVPLQVESRRVQLPQIVREVGRALKLARYLLTGTALNLLVQVRLDGVRNHTITTRDVQDAIQPPSSPLLSLEEAIVAEVDLALESLDDHLVFIDQVIELVCQLMWSFNWSVRQRIAQRTHEILTAIGIP